jgi:hypothetical protein
VFVPPDGIRSAKLGVDKAVRRAPVRDLADPAHGKTVHPQAILDSRTCMQFLFGADNMKSQPRRSDLFQVLRPREESKSRLQALRQPLLTDQLIGVRQSVDVPSGRHTIVHPLLERGNFFARPGLIARHAAIFQTGIDRLRMGLDVSVRRQVETETLHRLHIGRVAEKRADIGSKDWMFS